VTAPPSDAGTAAAFIEDLTPRQIVAALDRHVIGQGDAKKAVAVALRNRWRRQQLPPELAEDILPKNILMIGPTGVGKTEIARRLARLARAPFIKIEASKFTEVGYVGRDVESMIRDLVEVSVNLVKEEKREAVSERARAATEDRLLQLLLPSQPKPGFSPLEGLEVNDSMQDSREKLREKLRAGELEGRKVEVEVDDSSMPSLEMFTPQGVEEVGLNLKEMLPGMFGRRQKAQVTVAEAREILESQETEKLLDRRQIALEARHRVEQAGIVFLDEIDKVAGREGGQGPDVSRQGVQRDLLPIVEGTTVTTKHGPVQTDHILFIAAGAFHLARPSDLIPELQGRFPIRVELQPLTRQDFVRILTEPKSSLTRQYTALLGTEGVELSFTADAVEALARLAAEVNASTENIGARRLSTLMEKLLEEVSFGAPDMQGVQLAIDANYVHNALTDIVEDQDLSRYVL
jgi:ATP-dependent HslUV protease ATP-binding subunit HslU